MPTTVRIAKIGDSYQRYIGPLGSELNAAHGMNPTTHVASVRLHDSDNPAHERAVVKFFHFWDKGWLNEYACWLLAQQLDVATAPRAALLVGERTDITAAHGPELNRAMQMVTTPVVLWCTSAVEPNKNVQAALGRFWEKAVLHTDAGKRLAAMDAWAGNCDRIGTNALWWTAGNGQLVAIDHEKAAFNHDWVATDAPHRDEPGPNGEPPSAHTHLLAHINHTRKHGDKAAKAAARKAHSALYFMSEQNHPKTWADTHAHIGQLAATNFGTRAAARLVSFLSYRVTEDCMKRRYGLTI